MKPDIVSTPLLVFIAVGIPIIVGAIVYGAILALTGRKTFGSAAGVGVSPAVVRSFVLLDAHSFLVGLLLATLATAFVTDVIKGFAGRFRPDFLARCKWSAELNACTGNKKDISDGRRSFPSGHSSESFAGMTFLALFLGTVWSRIFDVEGSVWGRRTRAWRIILPFAPLLISTYCAISRYQDVHHPTDVAAGAALGAAIAAIVYFFYYRV
ncbi:phosphatidic acid phosphatase type 2/haloperoxidase [Entophlyctis helioformis]|nr:phosphatidic acid phosphatase type 2/haloperoxidase [Entophlyctis helioformis]